MKQRLKACGYRVPFDFCVWGNVDRIRGHKKACNRILKLADERLSGDRRVLIELVALYLDASSPAEKELFRLLLLSEFLVSPRTMKLRIKTDDPGVALDEHMRLESAALQEIKNVFELALQEENASTVHGDTTGS